jgi:hypothetical protein
MKKPIITLFCFFIAFSLSAQFSYSIELNDNSYPIETTGKRFVVISKDSGSNYNKITQDARESYSIKFPNKNKMIISGGKRGTAFINILKKTNELKEEKYTAVIYKAEDSNGEECVFANVIENGYQYICVEYKNRILIYE